MRAEPDNNPPRVALDLYWPNQGPVAVDRRGPDGRWAPVRTAEPAALAGGAWLGFDYEAPYGVPLRYRMRVVANALLVDPGTTVEIPEQTDQGFAETFTETFQVTTPAVPASEIVQLDVAVPWLIHPGIPDLSQPVRVVDVSPVVRSVRRGVFEPIGRSTAVVRSQRRSAPAYTLRVRTETSVALVNLDELLADGSALLWQVPPSLGWDMPTGWVSVADVDEARFYGFGRAPRRTVTLPLLMVDRPAGGQQAQWSYASVLAEHTTYQAVLESYRSYADLTARRPA